MQLQHDVSHPWCAKWCYVFLSLPVMCLFALKQRLPSRSYVKFLSNLTRSCNGITSPAHTSTPSHCATPYTDWLCLQASAQHLVHTSDSIIWVSSQLQQKKKTTTKKNISSLDTVSNLISIRAALQTLCYIAVHYLFYGNYQRQPPHPHSPHRRPFFLLVGEEHLWWDASPI